MLSALVWRKLQAIPTACVVQNSNDCGGAFADGACNCTAALEVAAWRECRHSMGGT